MATPSQALSSDIIIYPESSRKPMADNTQQFRWIVTIKENLEILYADRLRQQAKAKRQKAERLSTRLRELGVDLDSV